MHSHIKVTGLALRKGEKGRIVGQVCTAFECSQVESEKKKIDQERDNLQFSI